MPQRSGSDCGSEEESKMRSMVLSSLAASGLLLIACSRAEEAKPEAAAPPSAPAPAVSAPAPQPAPVEYVGFDYLCPDGVKLNARLDKGNMAVTVDGKTMTLAPTPGAAGAHYSVEGIIFIAQGEQAVFAREGEPTRTCKAE
jgi:membrane-bound inhibitor of C-type lysozyme